MGFSSWFYVVKAFEFFVVERGSVLHLVERSCGVSRAILLGKLGVVWLLHSVEELVHRTKVTEFFKSTKDGRRRSLPK